MKHNSFEFKNPNQIHLVFQEPGEREAVAEMYGIIGEGLNRMEKRHDGWYMDKMPVAEYKEMMDRLYEKDEDRFQN